MTASTKLHHYPETYWGHAFITHWVLNMLVFSIMSGLSGTWTSNVLNMTVNSYVEY